MKQRQISGFKSTISVSLDLYPIFILRDDFHQFDLHDIFDVTHKSLVRYTSYHKFVTDSGSYRGTEYLRAIGISVDINHFVDHVMSHFHFQHLQYMSRSMTKTKSPVRPAKSQNSLSIHTVWSVFAVRMKKHLATHWAPSEDLV